MFTPGLLVMVSLFGVMFVGFGVIDYLRSGVIERLRVTTASRLSLLMGMVARDVVTLLIQAFIVIIPCSAFGTHAFAAGHAAERRSHDNDRPVYGARILCARAYRAHGRRFGSDTEFCFPAHALAFGRAASPHFSPRLAGHTE